MHVGLPSHWSEYFPDGHAQEDSHLARNRRTCEADDLHDPNNRMREYDLNIRQLTTSADMRAASRLAYEVFVRECGVHGDRADHGTQTLTDDDDAAVIFGAFEGDELLGLLSTLFWADTPFPTFYERAFEIERFDAFTPRNSWVIMSRLVVHPRARSGSLLMRLFAAAWSHAQARGTQLVFIGCQPHLLMYYRHLGFRTYAPPYDYGDTGLGIPLVFVVADHQHLREIRSPSLQLVDAATEDRQLSERSRELLAEPGDPVLCRPRPPETHTAQVLKLLQDPPTEPHKRPFEGYCPAALEKLLERGYILDCARGSKLLSASQRVQIVYLVIEGELRGQLRGRGGGREFAVGRGEMVGKLASLSCDGSTADVYVHSARARVLCLDARTLSELGAPAIERRPAAEPGRALTSSAPCGGQSLPS